MITNLMSQLKRKRGQRGQSMVEFGMIVGVLVAMIIGGIDMGLAAHNMLVMQDAAGRGAQVAMTGGSDQEIKETIQNYLKKTYFENILVTGRLGDPAVEISPSENKRDTGDKVEVKINYQLGFSAGPLFGQMTILKWPISRTAVYESKELSGTSIRQGVLTLPFVENFEHGLDNWDIGGGGEVGRGVWLQKYKSHGEDYLDYRFGHAYPHSGEDHAYLMGRSNTYNGWMAVKIHTGGKKDLKIKYYLSGAGLLSEWEDSDGSFTLWATQDLLNVEYFNEESQEWELIEQVAGGGQYVYNDMFDFVEFLDDGSVTWVLPYQEREVSFSLPDDITSEMLQIRFRHELLSTHDEAFYYLDDIEITADEE